MSSVGNDHVYHCTLCLDLYHGEVLYNITNAKGTHGTDYEELT